MLDQSKQVEQDECCHQHTYTRTIWYKPTQIHTVSPKVALSLGSASTALL